MNNIRFIKLTIRDETKIFALSQNDVTQEEIISLYKEHSEDLGYKPTMKEFLNNAENYGIYLKSVDEIIEISL